jgi:hypothetical protein
MANPDRRRGQWADVRSFLGNVFGADMHAKRIDSLAGATLGVMQSASLAAVLNASESRSRPGTVSLECNT